MDCLGADLPWRLVDYVMNNSDTDGDGQISYESFLRKLLGQDNDRSQL